MEDEEWSGKSNKTYTEDYFSPKIPEAVALAMDYARLEGKEKTTLPKPPKEHVGVDIITYRIDQYSITKDNMEIVLSEYFGRRNYASTSGADDRRFIALEIKLNGELIVEAPNAGDIYNLNTDEKTLEQIASILHS